MTVATMGAFAIHELPGSCCRDDLYSFGELLEAIALRKSRRSVKELIDLRAEEVHQIIDGKLTVPGKVRSSWVTDLLSNQERGIPIDGLVNSEAPG